MGIEPTRPAWKAGILPLNYTRIVFPLQRSILYLNCAIMSILFTKIFLKNLRRKNHLLYAASLALQILRFKRTVFNANGNSAYVVIRVVDNNARNRILNFLSDYISQISSAAFPVF